MSEQGLRLACAGFGVVGALLLLGPALQGSFLEEEGAAQYASLRILGGSLPYSGFFLGDLPYHPVVYSPFARSLRAGRLFSGLLGVGILGLLYLCLRERPDAAAAALLLLATASPFTSWIPTFTPQAPALASALGAYALTLRAPTSGRALSTGGLLALASGFHGPYLLLIPLFALYWVRAERRRWFGWMLLGTGLFLLPCLLLGIASPGRFLWCVFAHGDLAASPAVSGARVGLLDFVFQPQWVVLILVALAALGHARTPASALALGSAAMLGVPFFLPVFSAPAPPVGMVPFLLLGALPAFDLRGRPALIGATALAALFIAHRAHEPSARLLESHSMSADMIGGVVEAIRRHARSGDTVLAFWPGYAALGGHELPPGMESLLSAHPDLTRSAGPSGPWISGMDQVRDWIREGRYLVVQMGRRRQDPAAAAALTAALQSAGYRRVHLEWDRSVWVRSR